MRVKKTRSRLVVAGAALALPAALLLGTQTASAAPQTARISGTTPRWLARTMSAHAASVAPEAAAGKRLGIRVYLTPKGGQQALVNAVAAVSDPSSASYGHYLTGDQYRAAYEPTTASAGLVTRYLRARGLAVTGTGAARRYVSASGTVRQLDRAFGVSLRSLSHDGQQVIAPISAASLPSSVASSVLTISGLDTTVAKKSHTAVPAETTPPTGFLNARPCNLNFGNVLAKYKDDYSTPLPTFAGQYLPYAPCGYTGPSFRAAYEGGSGLNGAGVTVAITDAYRWQLIAKDANEYAEAHGDGSYADGQLTENLPDAYNREDDCGPSGWSGEETLDVEAVHAMAPGANIRYYASASCYDDDFVATLGRVVDENVAQVVTNSWSDLESNESADQVYAYEQVFLQGAMQGQTFMFSSGDNGDELAKSGLKQVDYPASDPYVTAVGGTSTAIAYGKKLFDTGWGTYSYKLAADGRSWVAGAFLYGAGGGLSDLFNQPTYQNGVVPAGKTGGRAVPDIAMDADPQTGMLVGQTQTFPDGVRYGEYRIGGTSLASPLLAGLTALTIQQNGGRGFGAFNPTLYAKRTVADDVVKRTEDQLGVVRANYAVTSDPTSAKVYSLRTFGQDSSLGIQNGWDEVTGIGVPNAGFLKLTTPAS